MCAVERRNEAEGCPIAGERQNALQGFDVWCVWQRDHLGHVELLSVERTERDAIDNHSRSHLWAWWVERARLSPTPSPQEEPDK